MISTVKSKVNLNDYDWQKDVRCRLLLKSLSPFEVEVLKEVLFSSLSFSVSSLATTLNTDLQALQASLTKLSDVGLLSLNGSTVSVRKEGRKYFELQVERFEEDFKPNISFAFSLLKLNVPLHILPAWFVLSKSADRIWDYVIEKFVQTPEDYEKHLRDIRLDDPIAAKILKHFIAERPSVLSLDKVTEQWNCTEEELEKAIVLLEFHFVCFSGCVDGEWKLYPLSEWQEYLEHRAKVKPSSLNTEDVVTTGGSSFAFVEAMSSGLPCDDPAVADKLAAIGFDEVCPEFEKWASRAIAERAILLYRHPYNEMYNASKYASLKTDVAVRLAEKSLRVVADLEWVDFEEFFVSFQMPIGNASQVEIKGSGSRRRFQLPKYSELEKSFVFDVIFERLFQVGVVEKGTCKGKPCFRVTEFGKTII